MVAHDYCYLQFTMMVRFVSLFVLVICAGNVQGQKPMTIKVWPHGVPGAVASSTYKEETYYDNGKPRVTRVTDPEILVYLPAKEKANGTAVVICPGGGYGVLAIDHEGYDIARWFTDMGVAGIILTYRLPSDEIMKDKNIGPLQDVQEAIRIVRRNSKAWNVNPGKIGVMGFSAGGHLAGTASTLYGDKVSETRDEVSARPDFSILIYGVLSMQKDITHEGSRNNLLGRDPAPALVDHYSNELNVNAKTPPAFLVHSMDDGAVPMENSIRYYEAMKKSGVSGELHLYEKGGHGYGLSPGGGTESQWPDACRRWLLANGWL